MSGGLKVSAPDGVQVYTVSGGKSVPAWLSDKKKRSLKKDEAYRRRIELVQDLDFPEACQRLRASPDGQYLFATGIHPPRVRVYDLSQLSMKFERHLDAEVVDFQILDDDYSKAAFLCADRSVTLHAKFGAYYRTRIPKAGRGLAYAPFTADLLICGSAPEIYRLSLSEGRFLTPLPLRSPAANACALSPAHGLFGAAGEDGSLECFDLRQRSSVGRVDVALAADSPGAPLTALRFDDGGLHVAAGTADGKVALFDLRSSRPTVIKDHMYGTAITSIAFHSVAGGLGASGSKIVSSDRRIIKIWDSTTGANFTNIEPADGGDINDVCLWRDSGLIVVGCDAPKVQAFFVPALGPAPRWCSFLEGLTEELEENATPAVYDDYRFVTKADLEKLGLGHLLGTQLLRAYMHGYFVDARLYSKAAALARPFAYDEYRAQRIAEKVEAERQSRIGVVRKLPKVNAAAAARLLSKKGGAALPASAADSDEEEAEAAVPEADGTPAAKRQRTAAANPLTDDRFASMFRDRDFEIDMESEEYKLLHPNAEGRAKDKQLLREHFRQLPDVDEDEEAGSDDEQDDDGGGEDGYDGSAGDDEHDQQAAYRRRSGAAARTSRDPAMYAARGKAAAEAFLRNETLAGAQERPLGERASELPGSAPRGATRAGGTRELSFVPRRGGRGGRRGGGPRSAAGSPGDGTADRGRGASFAGRGSDRGRGGGSRGRGGRRGGGRGVSRPRGRSRGRGRS